MNKSESAVAQPIDQAEIVFEPRRTGNHVPKSVTVIPSEGTPVNGGLAASVASGPSSPPPGRGMIAKKVAAQFAAYVWLKECAAGEQTSDVEAMRFARENGPKFLACATEGLGRLLLQIARRGGKRHG
jgi:hypothetical protein